MNRFLFTVLNTFAFSFIFLSSEAYSVLVTIDQPPGNYRIFRLSGRSLTGVRAAREFNEFTFDIPDEHVVRNSGGQVNLIASLQQWRRNTPVGQGYPRTNSRGVGYYPFLDENGTYRYIALEHVYRNFGSRVTYSTTAASDLAVERSLIPRQRPEARRAVEEDSVAIARGLEEALPAHLTPQSRTQAPAPTPRPDFEPPTVEEPEAPRSNPHPPTVEEPFEATPGTFAVRLSDIPEGAEIFNLQSNGRLTEHHLGSFEDAIFEIPTDYLETDSSGNINLLRSLEMWRRSTPVGQGHPRTNPQRVAHYPFRDSTGAYRYIALEEIYMEDPSSLQAHSGQFTEVDQEISRRRQLPESIDDIDPTDYAAYDGPYQDEMRQLINIYQRGDDLSCNNPANGGAAMVCNCAGETHGNDFVRGDDIHVGSAVEINRSVLTRYHLSRDYGVTMASYQGSIEDIIEYRNSRGTAAFSWMMSSHRRCHVISNRPVEWRSGSRICGFTGNANNWREAAPLLNRCVKASMAALVLGPNGFDMYHNPGAASPSWYTQRMRNRGIAGYGEHTFSREGFIDNDEWEEFRAEHQINRDGSVR